MLSYAGIGVVSEGPELSLEVEVSLSDSSCELSRQPAGSGIMAEYIPIGRVGIDV